MSVKCPACGFDSPDGALFCDMCKEPFKKKGAAAVVDELKKLTPEERLKRVADELAKDKEREEQLPYLPPNFRYIAWGFLGLMVLSGLIGAAMLFARYNDNKRGEDLPQTPIGAPQIVDPGH
jgi:uncharacterized Zn finger protein (UPF0148 family)